MELSKDLNLTSLQKERILEKIRNDIQGRNSFKQFLAKEFAEENLLFIEDVEKFESAQEDERYSMGFRIFETYIKPGCEREVNIDAQVRKKITEKFGIHEVKKPIFREAFVSVLETLREDNLVRYMKSDKYELFITKIKEEREKRAKLASDGKSPAEGGKIKKLGSATPNQKKKRGISPTTSSPKLRQDIQFDDVLDLMFQVYEDIHEGNVADHLHEIEASRESRLVSNVTDFEMFLAGSQGPSDVYSQSTPKEREKEKKKEKPRKEKKEKEKEKKEKRGFFSKIRSEDTKKKKVDTRKSATDQIKRKEEKEVVTTTEEEEEDENESGEMGEEMSFEQFLSMAPPPK